MNKPDRLLTDEEFQKEFKQVENTLGYVNMPWFWGKAVAKAQDAKTASILNDLHQQEIAEIFEEIEKKFNPPYHLAGCSFDFDGRRNPRCLLCWIQNLKSTFLKEGLGGK